MLAFRRLYVDHLLRGLVCVAPPSRLSLEIVIGTSLAIRMTTVYWHDFSTPMNKYLFKPLSKTSRVSNLPDCLNALVQAAQQRRIDEALEAKDKQLEEQHHRAIEELHQTQDALERARKQLDEDNKQRQELEKQVATLKSQLEEGEGRRQELEEESNRHHEQLRSREEEIRQGYQRQLQARDEELQRRHQQHVKDLEERYQQQLRELEQRHEQQLAELEGHQAQAPAAISASEPSHSGGAGGQDSAGNGGSGGGDCLELGSGTAPSKREEGGEDDVEEDAMEIEEGETGGSSPGPQQASPPEQRQETSRPEQASRKVVELDDSDEEEEPSPSSATDGGGEELLLRCQELEKQVEEVQEQLRIKKEESRRWRSVVQLVEENQQQRQASESTATKRCQEVSLETTPPVLPSTRPLREWSLNAVREITDVLELFVLGTRAFRDLEVEFRKWSIQRLREYASHRGLDLRKVPECPETWQISDVHEYLVNLIMNWLEDLGMRNLKRALDRHAAEQEAAHSKGLPPQPSQGNGGMGQAKDNHAEEQQQQQAASFAVEEGVTAMQHDGDGDKIRSGAGEEEERPPSDHTEARESVPAVPKDAGHSDAAPERGPWQGECRLEGCGCLIVAAIDDLVEVVEADHVDRFHGKSKKKPKKLASRATRATIKCQLCKRKLTGDISTDAGAIEWAHMDFCPEAGGSQAPSAPSTASGPAYLPRQAFQHNSTPWRCRASR